MCGIAGIFDLRGSRAIDQRALTRMTRALAHRGPDGEDFHIAPGMGLGHRRLAIIDLAGGAQPFVTGSGVGVLSFNGEIYNYQSLAKDLEDRGARLRTKSDTETLAEGLEREGENFVEKLRGMYAFAFWNDRTQTLQLTRDRMGEKPLYYGVSQNGFLYFASELTALMMSDAFAYDIDPHTVSDYLHLGYAPDPKSIYKNVRKLPPAHHLFVERGGEINVRAYWRPDFSIRNTQSFASAARELSDRLDEAVAAQLLADVPVGAFLSGGLDSSAIVASMASLRGRINTSTIGFDEAAADERAYAAIVSDLFSTDHESQCASITDASLIDPVAQCYGEPFADPSALATYQVSAMARRRVTVALTGDGGDELFGGYRRYLFFLREQLLRRRTPDTVRELLFATLGAAYPKLDWAPRPLRWKTTLQSLARSAGEAYFRATCFNLPERAMALMSADLQHALRDYDPSLAIKSAFSNADTSDPLSLAQFADMSTWLPGRMLTKIDRASMAHGLETRPPLIDHHLVEWVTGLPPAFRLGPGDRPGMMYKRILKNAVEPRLPETIIHRKKAGFSPPIARWLRDDDCLRDRLRQSRHWRECGLFDAAQVETMLAAHVAGRSDFSAAIWSVIMFDAFLQNQRRPESN